MRRRTPNKAASAVMSELTAGLPVGATRAAVPSLRLGLFFEIGSYFQRICKGETVMPYKDIADLPKAQTDQYDRHQKEAFLKAFNNAYEEYGHDESRAFAVAHHAAKQAGKKEGAT
jgi:cation transport regulator